VNGHPMPLMMDSIGDESVINNLDERKYYVQMFTVKMMGYLLDEEDFEVNPAISRAVTLVEVSENIKRSQYEVEESEDKTIENSVSTSSGETTTVFPLLIGANIKYTSETLINATSVTYKLNGVDVTEFPFNVSNGDTLTLTINKDDINKNSEVILNGILT
jgi:hypothetical protein